MGSQEREFENLVRKGIARMKERREAELKAVKLAGEDPEAAAVGLIVFAREERALLRQELEERFGFIAVREREGLRCQFSSPQRYPRALEQKARFVDVVVALGGLELAQEAMFYAAVYFPWPDQPRKVCDAFFDVMQDVPAMYNAFAASKLFDSAVREYAAAMTAAWVRSHLKKFPGKMKAAMEDKDWTSKLVTATYQAWEELGPDAPIKRSTRVRDKLPRQKDGRRQKAPGPPDFINLVDRNLTGRGGKEDSLPEEIELARFANQEALLKIGRDAGLPPREMELYRFFIENPKATNREAADLLKVSVGTIKTMRHRIKNTLGAA